MYKPPRLSTSDFVENLINFISSSGIHSNIVLTGDTNICAMSAEFGPLEEICETFHLKQIVNSPTHNARLIDQIFVSENITIHSFGIENPIEKVHNLTWVKINIVDHNSPEERPHGLVWDYKNADWVGLNLKLMECNILNEVTELPTVDEAVAILQQDITAAMDQFIPKKRRRNKSCTPWITKEVISIHRCCRKAYRKWRRSRSLVFYGEYKRLNKDLKKAMFLAKRTHFISTFDRCTDAASLWHAIITFTGRHQRVDIPSLTSNEGQEFHTDYDKAEILRLQFSSVFNPPCPLSISLPDFNGAIPPNACVSLILKKLTHLKTKKAPGIDGITGPVIKNCSLVIAPCLAEICKLCLKEGSFPAVWKTAVVVPVPKVLGSNNPCDYRPISLLPLLSKVVESGINSLLMSQIDPLLSDSQFGFRQSRSTVDAILTFQHYVLSGFRACENANRATKVVTVFFDIAKAFDTVPHDKFLVCLTEKFNLPPFWTAVLYSYLKDRTMQVKVGGSVSQISRVESGVPQGSVLGPSRFISFFNQVAEVPLNSKSRLIMYADDLVYIHPIDSSDSIQIIQSDINLLCNCIKNMVLKLNLQKCKFMVMGLGNTQSRSCYQVFVEGTNLQQVSVYKYLGVDIDDRLCFASRVNKVSMKTQKCVGILSGSLRKWASRSILETAFSSIALPVMLYAIETWYPPDSGLQKKLCRVQKYAARLLTNNFNHQTHYEDLLKFLNWQSLHHVVAERRLLCIRKYINGDRYIAKEIFSIESNEDSIRSSQRIRDRTPKHCLTLSTLAAKNCREAKLAAAQMRSLWNALPDEVVKCPKSCNLNWNEAISFPIHIPVELK
jgi:hypothetical protein